MLMGVIFYVVYTKGLRGFSGVAIGGIVGLDILFLAFISGASMNPARALAPALLSGVSGKLVAILECSVCRNYDCSICISAVNFRAQRIRESES